MSQAVLKTCSYSVVHLLVAVAVAFALTGSWTAALSIGLIEPVVQTFAFAAHERIWSRWSGRAARRACGCGHSGLSATGWRWSRPRLTVPVLKTLSYGVMHMTVAITVAYVLTRDWRAALAVGLLEPMAQTIAYTLHDRFWSARERRAASLAAATPAGRPS